VDTLIKQINSLSGLSVQLKKTPVQSDMIGTVEEERFRYTKSGVFLGFGTEWRNQA